MPYYSKDPKRDHNIDNHPNEVRGLGFGARGFGCGRSKLRGEVSGLRVWASWVPG